MVSLTKEEAATGIYGAWRLACHDRGGMRCFDTSLDGFWKSFYAALFAAPGFVFLKLLSLSGLGAEFPLFRFLALQSVIYFISWFAFPLVVIYVTDALDRWERYFDFIVAFNWSNVLQMALLVVVTILVTAGVLPGALGMLATLVATLAIIYYEWFIAVTALQITGGQAAGVVAVDIVIGILLNSVVAGIL